ncbi:MAG: EF-P beta-lysylation protein EpmB [Pseudomonadota bacterium]
MITRSAEGAETPAWRAELATAFCEPRRLLDFLAIDPRWVGQSLLEPDRFKLRVPVSFAKRMRRGDPQDPLLRQVLPVVDEERRLPGYSTDPVGDQAAHLGDGLLQKYQGRALLIATGACAVHCRYCFRRHFPYTDSQLHASKLDGILQRIEADPGITELILSGGDPLMISDEKLAVLFERLNRLPQLTRVRIHSRLPIVLPSRITPTLVALLSGMSKSITLVVHSNHPNELNEEVGSALRPLRRQGITLLNQAVLLKGVNDTSQSLRELSERGFELGILPYYLHLLDPVAGAAHFAVTEDAAWTLMTTLRDQLPGYLVPRFVREVPGAPSKTPLAKLYDER